MTGAEAYGKGFKAGIKPVPILSVSEWADRFRELPRRASAEPGKWRTSRTPYLKEPMDCFSSYGSISKVKVMKGTQLGFTEMANNIIFYGIHIDPSPMMMTLPTVDLAKQHSKQKLGPSILVMPELKSRIKESKSKESGSTILIKEFPGGILKLGGANSGAFFRSGSFRVVILDDTVEYPADLDGQGSPIGLAEARTDAFDDRKILIISTPTDAGCNIEAEFLDSDQRYYYVPCPKCRHMQTLKWEGIKFEKDENYNLIGKPHYECESCKTGIEEKHKTWMLEHGEWRPHNPGHEHRGYHLSSLYSPLGWRSWADIIKEFLRAKKNRDTEAMKKWVNTRLAESWQEPGDEITETPLQTRREHYNAEVPEGVGILTASADVQKDRIEVEVIGWGMGKESWGIEHRIIYGDPAKTEIWKELDEYLLKSFKHEAGLEVHILCVVVDSGYETERVYSFVRPRQGRRVFAIKGDEGAGKPLVGRPSTKNIGRVHLFSVGVDTAKDWLHGALRLDEPGPGYCHFPKSYDDEFFRQLTSERAVFRKGKRAWEKKSAGRRNEALDLRVYALAALAILNPADIGKIVESLKAKGFRVRTQAKGGDAKEQKPVVKKYGLISSIL